MGRLCVPVDTRVHSVPVKGLIINVGGGGAYGAYADGVAHMPCGVRTGMSEARRRRHRCVRPRSLVVRLVVGVRELRRLEVRRGHWRVHDGCCAVVRRRLRPRVGGAVLLQKLLLMVYLELRMMLVLGPPSVVDLIRYHARGRVPRAARGVV